MSRPGLLTPARGDAAVFGAPLTAINREAGYLFQPDALFPWKTALENVAIGLETAGVPAAEARERAQAWLARVGLARFARPLSAHAVGRPAQARRPCAGADPRSRRSC